MTVMGEGENGKPWGYLCPGSVPDLVPKLAVVLVKSSPVGLALYFMLCLRENDGTRFVIC